MLYGAHQAQLHDQGINHLCSSILSHWDTTASVMLPPFKPWDCLTPGGFCAGGRGCHQRSPCHSTLTTRCCWSWRGKMLTCRACFRSARLERLLLPLPQNLGKHSTYYAG